MIELVDTHAHLQEPEFETDREAVIERARDCGVTAIVVPAVDLQTAQKGVSLAEGHAEVYATAGCHPHEASRLSSSDIDEIERLLAHPKVLAVGEIGLDFYRMHSPRDGQIKVFETMLGLAERTRLPVVIHCRDAWEALAPILEPWAHRVAPAFDGRPLGVLHYFSSDLATARRYIDVGFLISIHTSVTHPKAAQLREVAAALPLYSLVIETDSPYGAPQAHRGRRNEPAYVIEAANVIAGVTGISIEEVAATTTANARRLFRLEKNRTTTRRDVAFAASERRPGERTSSRRLDGPEGPSLRASGGRPHSEVSP